MSDVLAYIPWPSTGIAAGFGLVGGYLLGRWDEKRHSRKGTR